MDSRNGFLVFDTQDDAFTFISDNAYYGPLKAGGELQIVPVFTRQLAIEPPFERHFLYDGDFEGSSTSSWMHGSRWTPELFFTTPSEELR